MSHLTPPNLVILANEIAALVPDLAKDSITNNADFLLTKLEETIGHHALQGLSCFPPRDNCNVAPRVSVTEHNHTITCPKCGLEMTKPSYRAVYEAWWEHCSK